VVIVDTTVWIDYLQGVTNSETDWVHAELERQRLGLTDLTLCEILQGVRDESVAKDVERHRLRLEVFDTGGVELAREAARNYRTLRAHGHTVRKTIDFLIATEILPHAARRHKDRIALIVEDRQRADLVAHCREHLAAYKSCGIQSASRSAVCRVGTHHVFGQDHAEDAEGSRRWIVHGELKNHASSPVRTF
jgi:predicted nucleic acid-binding protein